MFTRCPVRVWRPAGDNPEVVTQLDDAVWKIISDYGECRKRSQKVTVAHRKTAEILASDADATVVRFTIRQPFPPVDAVKRYAVGDRHVSSVSTSARPEKLVFTRSCGLDENRHGHDLTALFRADQKHKSLRDEATL